MPGGLPVGTMNRESMRAELFEPGLREVFGLGTETVDSCISLLFHELSSNRSFEEMLSMAGIGYFNQLGEGQPVDYQTISNRYKSRFTHLDYATGLRYTRKLKRDLQYNVLSEAARLFGMSAAATRETLAFNFFNTGASVVWNTEEGKAFFAPDHPLSPRSVGASSYGNIVYGDPAYETIQEGITLLENTPNDMGYPAHQRVTALVYHPDEAFLVEEWFGSPGNPGNANRVKNVLAGRIPTLRTSHYITPGTMLLRGNTFRTYWFNRESLTQDMAEDFDTGDTKHKALFSCSCGAADWRGWVLIAGS